MSQALYAYKNPQYDDAEAAAWQATQVSIISLTNFLGRIFIGKNHLRISRYSSLNDLDRLGLRLREEQIRHT